MTTTLHHPKSEIRYPKEIRNSMVETSRAPRDDISDSGLWSCFGFRNSALGFLVLLATLNPQFSTGLAQGTAFTYQGRLNEGTNAATGLYDFRAQLYNRAVAGEPGDALIGTTLNLTNVTVSNGLFVVSLDFGGSPFNGEARWLSFAVRTNGALNYVTLNPRQPVTAAPYAILSGNLSGSLANNSLPTGGNWALSSTLTLDSSTLTIDPINNRVGLGTSTPLWPFHEVASQSVMRLDTTASVFGSVLELRNNTASPTYLGAINFNNAAGSYPGQIGYLGDDTLIFRTAGAERMRLDAAGNLLVTPASGVAVRGDASGIAFGIGVQGDAGPPFGIGVYGHAPAAFSVGVRAVAESTNSAGVTAEAMATSTETWGVRGLAHSASGSGVAGENDAVSGIGVYGLQGGGTGSRTPAGVYGESLQAAGNGVVGVAHNGTSAFGVWGRSTSGQGGVFDGGNYGIRALSSGTAGYFNNLTVVESDSGLAKPQLRLHETQDGDYARLEFQVASRPYWHLAVGGGAANQMNFYNSTNGNVMTLAQDGTLFVKVLTITGGADIAEPFQMSEKNLPKGAVVIIDEENPGKLKLSAEPYDRRVAGVISGAGGVRPGLSLQQKGMVEGDQQVALSGRVFVQAATHNGPIKPGDLLTTSATPGHAMKVTDHARAQGAILGKAMTALGEGEGLVLVLVTLQ